MTDLDDIFNEFLKRFEQLMDSVANDEYSDERVTSILREDLWELMARVLVVQRTGGAR